MTIRAPGLYSHRRCLVAVTIILPEVPGSMSTTKRFAVNVIMNWVAMAVSMVVPFFLTPFVIRSLGIIAYGIWILAVSTVSYLGILDLGLRSAIIRFVSKAVAQDKPEDATSTIAAALWVRLLICAGVALLEHHPGDHFSPSFQNPPRLQRAAQITVFCAPWALALPSFPAYSAECCLQTIVLIS